MEKAHLFPHQSPEVVVVEASAGTGKTFCLAKRYLQLLINPHLNPEGVPLRNILAITFTNRAAMEMKSRILEILKKIALGVFSTKEEQEEILSSLGVGGKLAQKRARQVMDEIINHYSFFQVQTIDSFINALLLGCALNIERSASFEIEKDYTQYISYCLDLAIEEVAFDKSVGRLLEEFLQHYLFVENRTSWFPKKDILHIMQFLFKLYNRYGKSFKVYNGESKDVVEKKRTIYQQITRLASQFPQGINAHTKKSILSFLEKNQEVFDISSLPQVLKNPEVPMNKNKLPPESFQTQWRKICERVKELVELDAEVAYNPYIKLFYKLLSFFHSLSKKKDVLFLEELNCKARCLFGEGGITVAEVYYRLATRFKHYLIDEFQDTSVLQWRNLEMMIEEVLSSGGSLFYVGDKKQAIYRFRGGEVKLFDEVRNKFAKFNVKSTYLAKNHRSQKAIVEFNNKVFCEENLRRVVKSSGIISHLDETSFKEILDIFKDAHQEYREENKYGYVKVEWIREKSRNERDELIHSKIIHLIKELKERFSCQDIAILTRDNNEVEVITSWLLEEGLSVESEKTLNVMKNSLIKEIVSFLKFLYSPIDDLSFASFILGDIFGAATGLSYSEMRNFLFSLHKEGKNENGAALYRLFRNRYPQVWEEYIEKFFQNIGFISLYELLVNIYQRFAVRENFRDNQAFFMKFLELIKTKEDKYVEVDEFLSYLKEAPPEDLYVNITQSDSLKVLTIHKSKGLEFPVVIIPFLRWEIDPRIGRERISAYIVEEDNHSLGLLRITKKHRLYSQWLEEIYVQNYRKAFIDELNNTYVAFTRAQYELYIFIPYKSGKGNNKAWFIIPEEIQEIGEKRVYEKKEKEEISPVIDMPVSKYKDWAEALKEEFGDVESIKNRERVLYGNVLHFLLSQIGNLYPEPQKATGVNPWLGVYPQKKEFIIKEIIERGKAQFPFIKDFSSIEKVLRLLLNKEELTPFFYIEKGEVYSEKEVVTRWGEAKRIDRLIVKPEEVWVIDYKISSQGKEEHKQQISQYIEIIKEIYYPKRVRGFLIYLEELTFEEVFP